MEDLVLSGGQVPCAADYEDLGSEICSMVRRYDSVEHDLHIPQPADPDPPKQVIYVLYCVLGLAISTLAALWVKMF